jgi:hypothetical protein
MSTGFEWDVSIDGTNVAVLVPETGTVDYGRRSVWEQPGLPVAVVDLVTADATTTLAEAWPEFVLGGSIGSGFVDTYADPYAGPSSRVLLGAPLTITATTPSGFTDTYGDEYAGVALPRFAGSIQAIDFTPTLIRLTCLPPTEAWARIEVGGTDDTTPIPSESDIARVQRLCDEAGVVIVITGTAGPDLTAIGVNTNPSPLLAQLQKIAEDAGGLFYTDREGVARYLTRNAPFMLTDVDDAVTLPSDATLLAPVAMSLELALVRTRVIVEYGDPDPVTNVRPTVTVEDPEQAGDYGWRDYRAAVQLQDEADALAYAEAALLALSPSWTMPNATVAMSKATLTDIAICAALEPGAWVSLPVLPEGAPLDDYAAPALGYTEQLSANDWQIVYHLASANLPIAVRT